MAALSGSVGRKGVNNSQDVRCVQEALNQCFAGRTPPRVLVEDGIVGNATIAAIEDFQASVVGLATPDGLIAPNGPTWQTLSAWVGESAAAPAPAPAVVRLPPVTADPPRLAAADFAAAAATLGCEVAAIQAVAEVETRTNAFDDQGRPTILFERHWFSRYTNGVYDAADPDISNPVAGGYGKSSAQYGRLERAMALDHAAALKSASWGRFQIMGGNHAAAGFTTVDGFVAAMYASEKEHLRAFVGFIESNAAMHRALRDKDWAEFASRYNGPNYKANDYDTKLAAEIGRAHV